MYHLVIVDEVLVGDIQEFFVEKSIEDYELVSVEPSEICKLCKAAGIHVGTDEKKDETGSFLTKQAVHYIRENYEKKLTLTKVAEELYVSSCYLSKILNQCSGKSFSDILNETRISKAKQLLRNPAFRVCDISEMVGFCDVAYFSKVFKKMEGISANEYRNKLSCEYSIEYVWKLKKVLDFSDET